MSAQFIYRTGSIDDLPQLKRLAIIAYSEYKDILTPENWELLNTSIHDEQKLAQLISGSKSFICLDGNNITGVAYLISSGNPWEMFKAEWAYIRMVGVQPDYRGKGIARKLTEMCIDYARQAGEQTIALHTSEFMHAARHVYESLGFEVLYEIPLRLGKRYWLYTLELDKGNSQ